MTNPAHARAVAEAMMTLWENELPATVRVLAAVKDDTRDYRPDPKSRSAWDLVLHIATSDFWFLECIEKGVFHYDPAQVKQAEAAFQNVQDIIGFYQGAISGKIAELRNLPDEQLAADVDFFGMMNKSRAAWIGFANNHSVHHRGQLSTHLRALGSKVPDIYGPSGDAEPAPAA